MEPFEERAERFRHALEAIERTRLDAIEELVKQELPEVYVFVQAEAFVDALFAILGELPPEKDSLTSEQRASAHRRWYSRMAYLAREFPGSSVDWASHLTRAMESAMEMEQA